MINQLVLITILYALFLYVEGIFPAEKHQSFQGKLRNIVFGVILLIVGVCFVRVFTSLFSVPVRILAPHGIIFSLGIVFCYILFIDIIFYWYHRAQHFFPSFFAIHMLHHSDTELNVTSSMRSYVFERPLQFLLISLPVEYLLGVDRLALVLLPIFLTFGLLFTHSNLRLRFGFFTPFLCGPQLHRIHHSIEEKHYNKNFAQFFPFLDIIFGTYYKPAYNEFPKTGIHSMSSNVSIKEALIRPYIIWFTSLHKVFTRKR